MKTWGWALVLALLPANAHAQRGKASYYTRASCQREGTSGIMANGRKLNDQAFTAASWDYPLGTKLHVCRNQLLSNEKTRSLRCTLCVVTDRGPARRLYHHGRTLDLSQAAFATLAPLSKGIIEVEITPVN